MARPQARAVPDPPNAWDLDLIEGENGIEIAELLEETTEIAVKDWEWRRLMKRRNKLWLQLRELGVTQTRMARAYAVNCKAIITATAITLFFRRYDEWLKGNHYNAPKPKPEETVEVECWCKAKQVAVTKKEAAEGSTRSCGERICHPPFPTEDV
jgi:hypothetical protein